LPDERLRRHSGFDLDVRAGCRGADSVIDEHRAKTGCRPPRTQAKNTRTRESNSLARSRHLSTGGKVVGFAE
jgi:hypothetical protein